MQSHTSRKEEPFNDTGAFGTTQSNQLSFGGYAWRILNEHDGKLLLISEAVLEVRAFHNAKEIATWAECDLRRDLNSRFFHSFNPEDKARIAESPITTPDNPRIGTMGGSDVMDSIFLLSIEEVIEYFGDSGQLENGNPNSKYWINDRFNSTRKAKDAAGAGSWWWLRSPGMQGNTAAYVNTGGSINTAGHRVYNTGGGVRPALWLKP